MGRGKSDTGRVFKCLKGSQHGRGFRIVKFSPENRMKVWTYREADFSSAYGLATRVYSVNKVFWQKMD